jgi:hypothetical protein
VALQRSKRAPLYAEPVTTPRTPAAVTKPADDEALSAAWQGGYEHVSGGGSTADCPIPQDERARFDAWFLGAAAARADLGGLSTVDPDEAWNIYAPGPDGGDPIPVTTVDLLLDALDVADADVAEQRLAVAEVLISDAYDWAPRELRQQVAAWLAETRPAAG